MNCALKVQSVTLAVVIAIGCTGEVKPRTLFPEANIASAPACVGEDFPADVLHRMARVYEACTSYADTGAVYTQFFVNEGETRTVVKPFRTSFVRPDQFRFEYTSTAPAGTPSDHVDIAWRSGDDVRTWWDLFPGGGTPATLDSALSVMAGVSSRSSVTVPPLLLPGELSSNPPLWAMSKAIRLADGFQDGARCFRIEGLVKKRWLTVWIDQTTYLLRRVDSRAAFDTFQTQSAIIIESGIDVEIAEESLKFGRGQVAASDR